MVKTLFAPSLMVGNLLNIENDIRESELGNADLLHIDIIDPTMGKNCGLPSALIPEIVKATDIPLDIHIASNLPEMHLNSLLPFSKGSYISVHVESTDSFLWIADKIRQAGSHPGIALNSSTSVSTIENLIPAVDIITVLTFDAGRTLNVPGTKELIKNKIKAIKKICEDLNRSDILIEADGGITFDDVREFKQFGVNVFVLGRDSIFAQEKSVSEKLIELRSYIINK